MDQTQSVSRRTFIGGLAAALSYVGFRPSVELAAQARTTGQARAAVDFDKMVKIGSNENPYGPSETILKAMTESFKYAGRYMGDMGVTEAIAKHHGVKPENVLIGAGSGEILKICDDAFLPEKRKLVAAEPTFESVFRYATNSKAEAIKIPLTSDYRHDMPGMAKAVTPDVGLVYLCNPNNPTGNIITKAEIQEFLNTIPPEVPVLIDEAYHHFVEHPDYATSLPYVLEGRNVIVARTFSKIFALAGIRLGYGVARKELIEKMRAHSQGSVSVVAKAAGVAGLGDPPFEAKIRKLNNEVRRKVVAELKELGYDVIPSDCNFFMVHIRRNVEPAIEEFRKKGIMVGRKFPPMLEHLRVSVGTEEEMKKFVVAFKEVMATPATSQAKKA